MTKKEAADLAALQQQLRDAQEQTRIAKALGFSGAVKPETVPPPQSGHFNGWHFNVHRDGGEVARAWSAAVCHGSGHLPSGPRPRESSAAQNGRALYRTKLDALTALRLEVEMECAKRLARIDRMIEEERKCQTGASST